MIPHDPTLMRIWSSALNRFLAELSRGGVLDRLMLNDTRWAQRDSSGAAFSDEELAMIPILSRLAAAVSVAGIPTASPEPDSLIAGVDHKWGRAPFHYVLETYLTMPQSLRDVALSMAR